MTAPAKVTSGRVALVTGASSGIGEATAQRLAQRGYTTYAVARRISRMNSLRDQGIHTVPVDVTDDASLIALVEQVIAESGRIDVLVNNAGYGSYGALEDVSIAEARRQFDVNIFAMGRLIQLVLPHMRAQHDGYIVNVSSVGGKMWEPMGSWYHATKFAVEGLSDSLRQRWPPLASRWSSSNLAPSGQSGPRSPLTTSTPSPPVPPTAARRPSSVPCCARATPGPPPIHPSSPTPSPGPSSARAPGLGTPWAAGPAPCSWSTAY